MTTKKITRDDCAFFRAGNECALARRRCFCCTYRTVRVDDLDAGAHVNLVLARNSYAATTLISLTALAISVISLIYTITAAP